MVHDMKPPDLDKLFFEIERVILADLASGRDVVWLAQRLCEMVECRFPGRFASVFAIGDDGDLHLVARGAGPEAVCSATWRQPIWHEGQLLGVFALTGDDGAAPAGAADCLLQHAGAVAGMILQVARRQAEQERQRQRMERRQALHDALLAESELLLHARREDDLLGEFCARLVPRGLFQIAWIARPDAAGVLQPLAAAGAAVAALGDLTFRLDDDPPSLIATSWKTGRPAHNNDYVATSRHLPWHDFLREKQWHAIAAIPIHRDGAIFAVLNLVATEAGLFDAEVLALCARVAALLGHGLDELDLKTRLEQEKRQQFHLARHDPLTGLPNRLQFEEHLQRAIARARRQQTLLAVGLLDLDDFKPVNDSWGHAVGDLLLRQLAERLRALLRASDLLARFGGDEFVLAIEGLTSLDALPGVLDRLRRAIETPFDLGDGRAVSITFSLGVALVPEDGSEPDLLLRRADAALYQTKAGKIGPHRDWWRRWRERAPTEGEGVLVLPDAYGPEAAALLASGKTLSVAVAEEFISEFFRHLTNHPLTATALRFVTDDDLAFLKTRQIALLTEVLAPSVDRVPFAKSARFFGRLYALTNVDSAMIAQGVGLYQNLLSQRLAALPLRTTERARLVSVINARLQDLTALQLEAHGQTLAEYHALLVRPLPSAETLWVDTLAAHLEALGRLPGIVGIELLRPDAAGTFQIEASGGTIAETIQPNWRRDGLMSVLDINHPQGRGLLASAWRTREIQTCPSYAHDPRVAPWRDAMRKAGIRSAAVLPVRDAHGRAAFVLALFGAYPGQFEALWMRQFCTGLMQRLTLIWQQGRVKSAEVVPETTAETWRQRLFSGGLEMYYQPLVNLRTGQPSKVEALARLVLGDGNVVTPGQFLPVLGEHELDLLFRLGLAQALRQITVWDDAGVHLDVSVNLPPATLLQPDCPLWVRDALAAAGIAPRRLHLEIMETGRVGENEGARDAILHRLSRLGVRIVMDDLGSGYSSLQRLRLLPFHAVKIDQSLVRDVWRDPIRVLGLIGALVQLGRDLELDVVVEGLESDDLVEAAAILRAGAGQGHALARPMPGAAVLGWMAAFTLKADPTAPRTALGALAALWRLEHGGDPHLSAPEQSALGRFIAGHDLGASRLAARHREQHAIARADGPQSPRYQALAAEIRADLQAMCRADAP